ncbi:MAG: hypothetical protein COA36_01535 [Desulfotalea sp.]|nr:MAG: hypothetical protein COA36_01535 [Desulfotalea sp.]
MECTVFNPFEDRFSRDMRNALSSALASAIETGVDTPLLALIEDYRSRDLAPHYQNYFQDRWDRFTKALTSIQPDQEPIAQAVILWNHGLFFEVHEVLEHVWYHTLGNEKLVLQALIRAAGVYVKQEYGYTATASKIAGKSWPVLKENAQLLTPYFNPGPLILALQHLDKKPPKL